MGYDTPTMSPLSTTVNVNYIISAMKKFLKALGQKEPDLVPRGWIFSSSFTNLLSLLYLAQSGYTLFLKLKRELAASLCFPGRGHKEVGGGHLYFDQRRLPQGAQEGAIALGKVSLYWQWICKKRVRKNIF
jgi:hypothetical protein